MTPLHINYGRARREAEPDETCMYCDRHFKVMAYTYFGAPVCEACWEECWRKTEDGECDPPFSEIANPYSGEWIA
jgi:hypothetical protein